MSNAKRERERGMALVAEELINARAEIERLQSERDALRDQLHYANGTCDLAMKHRDEAEAERDEARTDAGDFKLTLDAIARRFGVDPTHEHVYSEVFDAIDGITSERDALKRECEAYRAALRQIAHQPLIAEMDAELREGADYEAGYEAAVRVSRARLAAIESAIENSDPPEHVTRYRSFMHTTYHDGVPRNEYGVLYVRVLPALSPAEPKENGDG